MQVGTLNSMNTAIMANNGAIDDFQRDMLVIAYDETVEEALGRGETALGAHKEGVVAASMLLSALVGLEDDPARRAIVSLGLRPRTRTVH